VAWRAMGWVCLFNHMLCGRVDWWCGVAKLNSFFSVIGVWRRGGKTRPQCGERMGFNNIGVGYRDATV